MKRTVTHYLIIFLLYSLIAAIFTWPLVTDLSGQIYGYPGDNFGFIYYLWWWKYSLLNHLNHAFFTLQEAPFGMPILPDSGAVVYYWPTKLLALIFNEGISYNLNLLLSFSLSGLFTYILINHLTRDKRVSFIFGLVFAFSPYHLWRAFNHLDLAMIQYLPLYFWALIVFLEKKSRSRGFVAGACYSLIYLTNFYYAFFAFLASLIFAAAYFGQEIFEKRFSQYLTPRYIKALAAMFSAAILPFFIFVIPAVREIDSLKSPWVGDLLKRPAENLLMFSARPWDYLLPASNHPIFGQLTLKVYDWLQSRATDWKLRSSFLHERQLFLGYFSIILCLLTVYWCIRKRLENRYFIPFTLTLLLLVFLSAPPYIFIKGVKIVFPSYFLYHFFPMFRSYTRVGVLVLLFTIMMAAVGYKKILEKCDRLKLGRAIFLLSAALVIFEFLNFPPARVTKYSEVPPAYQWLAEQSGSFIIVEYPKEVNIAEIQMYQRYHLKSFLNFHDLSPNYKVWDSVKDIYDENTPANLAKLGVKYALLHKKPLFEEPNPVDDLWWTRAYQNPIDYDKIPAGFRLVQKFEKMDILEITAPPI